MQNNVYSIQFIYVSILITEKQDCKNWRKILCWKNKKYIKSCFNWHAVSKIIMDRTKRVYGY